ncbi:MAG: ROK family protein [Salinivirgaceae bacterium]|jgi:glucokinase|nr:ROK family protein [Salinivirgaceae bacterium]
MINHAYDNNTVLTLDAGGTNFEFSAIKAGLEIIEPITLPSNAFDLTKCLKNLVEGFSAIISKLDDNPVAISFAFPGPADYPNGIIGDLPNLPAFRGGVALGNYLQEKFKLPVFINNDGNLFAYGEAMLGMLPEINKSLTNAGNSKQYHNLIGITLGTGFGAGLVFNNHLLIGDNSNAAETWLLSNRIKSEHNIEELVSQRAIVNTYKYLTAENDNTLTPFDIYKIAKSQIPGDKNAALNTFNQFGHALGDAIANLITLFDGIVVIGGGISAAKELYMPALIQEINNPFKRTDKRLVHKVYDFDDEKDKLAFITQNNIEIQVPESDKSVLYNSEVKTAIAHSKLGASKAIQLGAYLFALNSIESI